MFGVKLKEDKHRKIRRDLRTVNELSVTRIASLADISRPGLKNLIIYSVREKDGERGVIMGRTGPSATQLIQRSLSIRGIQKVGGEIQI